MEELYPEFCWKSPLTITNFYLLFNMWIRTTYYATQSGFELILKKVPFVMLEEWPSTEELEKFLNANPDNKVKMFNDLYQVYLLDRIRPNKPYTDWYYDDYPPGGNGNKDDPCWYNHDVSPDSSQNRMSFNEDPEFVWHYLTGYPLPVMSSLNNVWYNFPAVSQTQILLMEVGTCAAHRFEYTDNPEDYPNLAMRQSGNFITTGAPTLHYHSSDRMKRKVLYANSINRPFTVFHDPFLRKRGDTGGFEYVQEFLSSPFGNLFQVAACLDTNPYLDNQLFGFLYDVSTKFSGDNSDRQRICDIRMPLWCTVEKGKDTPECACFTEMEYDLPPVCTNFECQKGQAFKTAEMKKIGLDCPKYCLGMVQVGADEYAMVNADTTVVLKCGEDSITINRTCKNSDCEAIHPQMQCNITGNCECPPGYTQRANECIPPPPQQAQNKEKTQAKHDNPYFITMLAFFGVAFVVLIAMLWIGAKEKRNKQ